MKHVVGVGILVGVGLVGVACATFAAPAPTQEVKTIQGEVVDPALYLREGRHGSAVEHLIYDAVDGGQALALLEEATNALYLFLASEPGADPNELVYEYAGRKIKVTGTVYERGGLKGVVVASVIPLEAPAQGMPQDIEP